MADDTEKEMKALVVELKTATDQVKTFAEKYTAEMKNLGDATQETKTAADKALTEMNTLAERMTAIEQKMVRNPGGDIELKSLGELFIQADNVKALMASKQGQARVTVELKDITSGNATVGAGRSPGTSLVPADRVGGLIGLPQRRLVVRDLITPGTTASSAIEYVKETDDPAVTGAAVVSEGQMKPQSNLTFDMTSTPVRTIAHFMKASRQIMDDAPQLRSFIDGRLRYGLEYVEETELLYGDGTGQHLFGIIPQATAYAAPFAPALLTNIDALRLAQLQAALAMFPASGYVLHPTDWAKIELTKDTTGRYIVGDPQSVLGKRLWALPVVDTQAMIVGHFLTGAFQMGAQIFDRMAIEVLLSTENQDDFVRNMVTIRGEERLALAVYRPQAFTYGVLPV